MRRSLYFIAATIFLAGAAGAAPQAKQKQRPAKAPRPSTPAKPSVSPGVVASLVLSTRADSTVDSDSFDTTDRKLYGVVRLKRPAPGTRLRGVWVVVDANGIKNHTIGQSEQTVEQHDLTTYSVSLPRDWPLGKYRFDLFVNGKLDRSHPFSVKELGYQPAEGGFRARFQFPVRTEVKEIEGAEGRRTVHRYSCSFPGMDQAVEWWDLPASLVGKAPAEQYAALEEAVLGENPVKVEEDREVLVDSLPGRESVTLPKNKKVLQARVAIHQGRVYVVSCLMDESLSESEIPGRFLDSFRFAPAKAAPVK